MPGKALENIVVVLVGTKYSGNVGSIARAMHNMGLRHLRLAAAQSRIDEECIRMARSGVSVLEQTREFTSLKSALRGIAFTVGTTGKTGVNRSQVTSPGAFAPEILSNAQTQKVAIIFGPEDTGLVNDDLLLCQRLIRIPTHPEVRSLNLAQAVMIVSYELYLAHLEREPARAPKLATIAELEPMYEHLEQALKEIGFLTRDNTRHMMSRLRRLLGRASLEPNEASILRGIARQIRWYTKQK